MDCDQRKDPVARQVRDASAEEMVDWMVKYHHLPEEARATVVSNLREQFRWHRLQGRLDQRPTAAVVAELLLLRRNVRTLDTPPRQPDPPPKAP